MLKLVEDVKHIPKNKNSVAVQRIKIVGDQTKMQWDYFKCVKAELGKLIQSGVSNKTIKYVISNQLLVINARK